MLSRAASLFSPRALRASHRAWRARPAPLRDPARARPRGRTTSPRPSTRARNRIGGLRALECSRAPRILEVVERGEALEKIRLRGRVRRSSRMRSRPCSVRRVQRQRHDERRNGGDDDPKIHVRAPVIRMAKRSDRATGANVPQRRCVLPMNVPEASDDKVPPMRTHGSSPWRHSHSAGTSSGQGRAARDRRDVHAAIEGAGRDAAHQRLPAAGLRRRADQRFPVLYMPDGGLAEDFLHVAGLVQVRSATARCGRSCSSASRTPSAAAT